ncbi:hypothetical protein GCM10012287_48560 [Streptomyces daqingensis]|uniref:Peptidase S8/S53 domain-containing protein n=1 Tax=Streptomyces daqingensis TaxID=1472640 RepID=A0ABQ2MU56_9ACTN|nr:S8 family serine peptidase [Streptomyces daqingensis]GGO55997.1 hypothetical protein GCM10012287_48560 [Streptomyces daqingensis]
MGITRTLQLIGSAALAGTLIVASAPSAAADDVRDKQWVLGALDTESVWKITKGEGEIVAVIDDGVNAEHPDLKGNVLKGKDFIDGGSTAPKRGEDHGTGMAAMIAGHGHGPGSAGGIMGLAPEAKILPLRDSGEDGNGFSESIKYAVDEGASVISISRGGDNSDLDEADAIAYALKRNVPIFASTGNSGGSIEYPAAYPGVVPVGGVKQDGEIWSKSNRGPKTLLTGPATQVLTAGGENSDYYRYGTGTSDATAYAAAAAALVRSKYPDLTAGQVVNRLTETASMPASEKGAKLPDERYGYGAIRPLDALQADVPKGSKYGPLSLPRQIKQESKGAQKKKESQALQKKADREFLIAWSVIGVVALVAIGVLVLLVARSRRKKNRNSGGFGGPGGPGVPGGYPYPPHQAPAHGMPRQQQRYAQQQMPAPPQQPPHN